LFKTESVEKLVRYALLTGAIKREISPLSIMLIAPPEHNKTSILKCFENSKNIAYSTDLSPKPLVEFLKKAADEKYYHLIIPDFIKVVAHNKVTAFSTITTLNAAIEEGIQNSLYYGQEIHLRKNVQVGLITSITPDLYKQQFKQWSDIGFLTRFIPVSYMYSNETRFNIMKMIEGCGGETLDEKLQKLKRTGQKDISIGSDVSSGIALYVEQLVEKLNRYEVMTYVGQNRIKLKMNIQGFRLHKQIRLLAKAIAFDHGLDEVNYECLAELKNLIEYINVPSNPKEV
jgi:hypothetical protein